jgi:hypothetical protein
MKNTLMVIMAVAVLMGFSVSAFAGDKDEKKRDKKGGYTDIINR